VSVDLHIDIVLLSKGCLMLSKGCLMQHAVGQHRLYMYNAGVVAAYEQKGLLEAACRHYF
jgi:hypothetical protein